MNVVFQCTVCLLISGFGTLNFVEAQFSGGSLFSLPWAQSSSYPSYGKPIRPSPFGYGSPVGNYGRPSIPSTSSAVSYDDDPLPLDGSVEIGIPTANAFPSKLPIKAPNGVMEIYNRVVDDLIKKLKVDFEKNEIDPMSVVIRSTPQGPVRVPGHMQKRPYRRPGAALYRSNQESKLSMTPTKERKDEWDSSESAEHLKRAGIVTESPRSSPGKSESSKVKQTEPEPTFDEYPASDELFSDEAPSLSSTTKKPKPETEDDETAEIGVKSSDVVLQNRKGNPDKTKNDEGEKPTGGKKQKKRNGMKKVSKKKKPEQPSLEEDEEDDPPEQDDDDEESDDFDDAENYDRPPGGYYPEGGLPAVPAKPNAELHGLSRMVRTSDVTVGVDARSAVVTAKLLIGPLVVHINDSTEPMERGVKATIPELEAEIVLLERHGVVFLQRFTLDRAYGQDIEISVPKKKPKGDKKRQEETTSPGFDPTNPAGIQRFQTKMGAHISMEMVKLLRSGNLRLNVMRIAQGSMRKLRLPIKDEKVRRPSKKKGTKKKLRKTKVRKNNS